MNTSKRLSFVFGGLALVALSACGGEDTTSSTSSSPVEPTDACIGQASGTACTWLGVKGEEGFNDDGNQRFATRVNQIQDLLFLPDGSAVFSDFNNYLVRHVSADGVVTSLVGKTNPVFPGDGPPGGPTAEGADGKTWQLNHPTNLLLAPDGSLTLVAWHNHKILTIDVATGWVKILAGVGPAGFAGDGGPATKALFKQPNDATYDEDGNMYISDQQNWRVRKIDTKGDISTIAGKGTFGTTGDGGDAIEAEFSWAFGSNPNPSGSIIYHEGKLYLSDTEANRIRVMDLATGMVDAFAGTGEKGFGGDGGDAKTAKLNAPRDLEIGPDGDLYFADTDNSAVRAIDLETGMIRTVAGTGELGLDAEEQLPATETHLRRPFGIAFDKDGNLYIMDTLNSRIVKVAK